MPIYDRRCAVCKYVFEYIQLTHDEFPVFCPKCGKETELLPTAPGFIKFRGPGWSSKKDYYGDDKKKQAEKERREKA